MVDNEDSFNRKKILDELAGGKLVHPRFTQEEIKASYGSKHETLWNSILCLESAKVYGGRGIGGGQGTLGETEQNCKAKWNFSELGTCVGWNPGQGSVCGYELGLKEIKFLDRGVESVVYVTARNTVRKFRQIHPYSANAVLDELAKLVYHNYLFPNDAYVLNDILRYKEGGYNFFFLDMEQSFVAPLIDENNYIIPPTYGEIFEALQKTPLRFKFHHASSADSSRWSTAKSTREDSEEVPAARIIAYNDQFMIYDFQPGRNTFIDAVTGDIRFIDPRIDINSPDELNAVSKFGKRKKDSGLFNVHGIALDEMSMPDKLKEFLAVFKR